MPRDTTVIAFRQPEAIDGSSERSRTSAPDEERQRRKRRLLKGPKEFRDVRGGNRPKLK